MGWDLQDFAANEAKIAIPEYGDKYSGFVKQLEAGKTEIGTRVDYFEISKVFEGYKRLGIE